MSKQRPARNDPCGCGSGVEFKRCCAQGEAPQREPDHPTITVRHNPTKQTWKIGAPGVRMAAPVLLCGPDFRRIMEDPSGHFMSIRVEVPAFLNLDDSSYDMTLGGRSLRVSHWTRRRGEEEFSSLDTRNLPYFSCLEIT